MFTLEQDERPPRNGWAGGGYECKCLGCDKSFLGDKRCLTCADCGYKSEQETYSPLIGDISMMYITEKIPPIKRVIVTAANKVGDTGLVLVGVRHWDKLMNAQWKLLKTIVECPLCDIEQGFVDQYGQFLSRDDAYYIAHHNEQPLIGEDWGQLYSENLY